MLLLRAAVGVVAMMQGSLYLEASANALTAATLAGGIAMASGVTLLLGFLTPVAGALVTLGEIGVALSWFPSLSVYLEPKLMGVLVAVVAAAICLLGPGALSLDAHLFGRHEIIIPRAHRSLPS